MNIFKKNELTIINWIASMASSVMFVACCMMVMMMVQFWIGSIHGIIAYFVIVGLAIFLKRTVFQEE